MSGNHVQSPRRIIAGDIQPQEENFPILTDDEIIGLFSDLEPLGNYMLVVPKRVDKRTEDGIRKTDPRL